MDDIEELRELKAVRDAFFKDDAAQNAALRAARRQPPRPLTRPGTHKRDGFKAEKDQQKNWSKLRKTSIFNAKTLQRKQERLDADILPDSISSHMLPTTELPGTRRKRRIREDEIPVIDMTIKPESVVSASYCSRTKQKRTVHVGEHAKSQFKTKGPISALEMVALDYASSDSEDNNSHCDI